jgi:intein/homing endonuclease
MVPLVTVSAASMVRPGDPTVILAGSPPEGEYEYDEDDYYYDDEEYYDDDEEIEEEDGEEEVEEEERISTLQPPESALPSSPPPVTVRGRGGGPSRSCIGVKATRLVPIYLKDKLEPPAAATMLNNHIFEVDQSRDLELFSFIGFRRSTTPPQATTLRPSSLRRGKKRVEDIPHSAFHSFLVEPPQGRGQRGESGNSNGIDAEAADDGEADQNNQKKRGIDWSQKLRERNRRKIWKQFRLN